jgi:hypothetical protein
VKRHDCREAVFTGLEQGCPGRAVLLVRRVALQNAGRAAADLPQRLRLAQLAKQHADEMLPRAEAFAMLVVAVLVNQLPKIMPIKKSYNLSKKIYTFRAHFDLRFVGNLEFAQT